MDVPNQNAASHDANCLYAFVHIEKASGTSPIHELRSQFLFRHADVRPLSPRRSSNFSAADLRKFQKLVPGLRCISGHSIVPCEELEGVYPCVRYLTILREPLARMESHYNHWLERKGYDRSFDEFIEQEHMGNFMCRKVCGLPCGASAVQALREKFIAYGVVENLGAFYAALLRGVLEISSIPQVRHLNKRKAQSGSQLSREQVRRFYEINQEDVDLYQWVSEVSAQPVSSETCPSAQRQPKFAYWRGYADYLFRKAWIEPVSGGIRLVNGLPYRGSYQADVFG